MDVLKDNKITKKWLFIIVSIAVLFLISAFLFSLFQSATKPSPYPGVNMPTKKLIPDEDYVTGQISVKFKKGISKGRINSRLKAYNASIISTNDAIDATLVKVPKGKEMEIMEKLAKDRIIEYVEYDYKRQPRFTPNDPSYGQQWHLKKIQADKAWDVTRGAGIKIAVVDTGVDVNHPDLKSKIAATKGSVTDSDGHGTHVAGIMAAATNNAIGIASVCPDCKILAAKDGNGSDSGAAAAITWAADQGAKAINMSWGGSQNSSTLKAAIDYAFKKGALPVGAVQNENINDSKDYPSSYPNVMSVTNSTSSDVKFTQAGYGTWVWIAAPGSNIYSTVPGSKFQNMSGTSMATPVIVGAIGMVAGTSFGSTPTAARQRLCSTADKITGTGTQFKCGRVNLFKAVGGGAPTVAPSIAPTVKPTTKPTAGIPSPNCLGSCPTEPPVGGPEPTIDPSDEEPEPTIDPSDEEPEPTIDPSDEEPEPTIDPSDEEPEPTIDPSDGEPTTNNPNISKFFKLFLQFFILILIMIFGGL